MILYCQFVISKDDSVYNTEPSEHQCWDPFNCLADNLFELLCTEGSWLRCWYLLKELKFRGVALFVWFPLIYWVLEHLVVVSSHIIASSTLKIPTCLRDFVRGDRVAAGAELHLGVSCYASDSKHFYRIFPRTLHDLMVFSLWRRYPLFSLGHYKSPNQERQRTIKCLDVEAFLLGLNGVFNEFLSVRETV